jgi:hypothetical protein
MPSTRQLKQSVIMIAVRWTDLYYDGSKATFGIALSASALPPKADIRRQQEMSAKGQKRTHSITSSARKRKAAGIESPGLKDKRLMANLRFI